MNRLAGCWMAAMLLFGQASAQEKLALGDSWTYRTTTESLRRPIYRTHVQEARYVVGYLNVLGKPAFERYDIGPEASATRDLHSGMTSDTCLIDIPFGKALPGAVPCDAPLPAGKRWYAENAAEAAEEWLTVTGQEEVRVLTRPYRATVIRSDRLVPHWHGAGSEGLPAKRKIRSTYWYVPELKGMARIVREHLDDDGSVLFHETSELLEFSPAAAGKQPADH